MTIGPRTGSTRRAVLAGSAGALAAPFVIRGAAAQAKELRLLVWEGYAEKAWVEPFEAATGARCKISYVGSADEMFAKMVGSRGEDFDVVSFDTSAFARYINADLLQPVDLAKVPRAANILPEFREVAPIMRGETRYGVPFAWGSLPLVYDADAFPTPPESWEVMWDPQYAQQMISQDDANNCITLGAIVTGAADPFNLSDADLARITAKMIEQKGLLLTYYAGFDDGVSIFASSGIKLMYSMGEPQVPALREKGVNAALTIPKEGAIGWLDCWTISRGAKDVELAHAWIDRCMDPAVGAYLSEKLGYGNVTNAEVNGSSGLTYGDRLIWLQTPEDIEKRVKVWNEIKAAS
jgi:putative spermidine/putrescine transport system substrate-binding protein/spermidine/putrescine transport system substrate-binding protein